MTCLPRAFYDRHAALVARQLLGCRLVRLSGGEYLAGLITETEAYHGENDLGCHARAGLTPRTRVMYGPPGYAYIYFTYGMHWLLNAVCEPAGQPAAVLLRAIHPVIGLSQMAVNRPRQAYSPHWLDGPAKLTQALHLDGDLYGVDLCDPASELTIEDGIKIPDDQVVQSPRIGLFTVPEPWKSIPWRFTVSHVGIG